MTYNDLFFLAKEKEISIASLANDIGMTSNGLKKSFESKKLPWEKIESLCNIFRIAPNQLLGWPETTSSTVNYASNITGGNTQNSNEAILALREELKEKGGIIKEKDKQINRLLGIIERNKFK